MEDILVGIVALAVGALFCFRGFIAMRFIIPLWGTFAGFLLGAGFVAGTGDVGFLRTGLSWVVGIGFGLLFGALAYLYYEVSIVLAMASVGFALGTGVMVALGVSWSWLIVLVGVAIALLLAIFAVATDLPGVFLVVLSALGGATVLVAGAMLLTGALDTSEFTSATVTQRLDDSWWWYLAYVVLAIIGVVAQGREAARMRASIRQSWAEAGGRALRGA